MKTFKFYLCIAMFVLSLGLIAGNNNPEYTKAMDKALVRLDTAKTVNDIQQAKNMFERISVKYNDEWLPVYYVAYSGIQMVYFNPKGEKNQAFLDDAKKYIDKLGSFDNADKSEVHTLTAYYYNALIMLDPAVNGQKYYNEVTGNYEKAMGLNKENPRPVFLLAFFEQNLPDFLRSKRDFCEEMNRAKVLFSKEGKSMEKPYWGEYFFKKVSTKCNN